jgi:hypothetical protein
MNMNYKILRLSIFISFLIILTAFGVLEMRKLFREVKPVIEIMDSSIVPVSAYLLGPGFVICALLSDDPWGHHGSKSSFIWPILLSSFLFYTIFLFFLIKLIRWLRLKIKKHYHTV